MKTACNCRLPTSMAMPRNRKSRVKVLVTGRKDRVMVRITFFFVLPLTIKLSSYSPHSHSFHSIFNKLTVVVSDSFSNKKIFPTTMMRTTLTQSANATLNTHRFPKRPSSVQARSRRSTAPKLTKATTTSTTREMEMKSPQETT
jgi:hypothetical protein